MCVKCERASCNLICAINTKNDSHLRAISCLGKIAFGIPWDPIFREAYFMILSRKPFVVVLWWHPKTGLKKLERCERIVTITYSTTCIIKSLYCRVTCLLLPCFQFIKLVSPYSIHFDVRHPSIYRPCIFIDQLPLAFKTGLTKH